MKEVFNQPLYEVVRKLYEQIIAEFANEDLHSEAFLASFPYAFLREELNERRSQIIAAALRPEFRQEVQKSIGLCYSDSAGGDVEFYLCEAVEDFLNYIIPRTVGLANCDEVYNRYYGQFDSSIYGKSCLVTVSAIIRDLWDHHGFSVLPPGFRLCWLSPSFGRMDIPYARERGVPFFEVRKAAHPIGGGRDLSKESAYLLLQHSAMLPKKQGLIGAAYALSAEIVNKFVLAARITTYSTVHSDYRGFRMLGHLSAYSMNLMNYPDDQIEGGEGHDLGDSGAMAIDRLLTKLLPKAFSRFAVVNQKIEDAMRRRRTAMINDQQAQKLNEIDQLLDYFQVLEAIVPAEGSQYISLYAARLLQSPSNAANQAFELFKFIKDMHKIRNSVLHGRVDEVLSGKLKTDYKLDIPRLRHIIYSLTCLYIMNGSLREHATRLALGEQINLEREYETNQTDWMNRRRSAALRNSGVVFW